MTNVRKTFVGLFSSTVGYIIGSALLVVALMFTATLCVGLWWVIRYLLAHLPT